MFKLITGVAVIIAIVAMGSMLYQRYMPELPVPADFGNVLDSLGNTASGLVADAAAFISGENQPSDTISAESDSSALAGADFDSLAAAVPPADTPSQPAAPGRPDSVVVARQYTRDTHYKVLDILEGR